MTQLTELRSLAVVQNTSRSFNFNGESDLDLEYAMGLTAPQPITLLQTGDLSQGKNSLVKIPFAFLSFARCWV